MKRSCCLLLLLLPAILEVAGQLKITGTVFNQDHQPLAYVNIGIREQNIGTISDSKGGFRLTVPPGHRQDSLSFSSVGFKVKTLALAALSSTPNLDIVLKQDTVTLEPVVLRLKKTRVRKTGIHSYSPFLFAPPINEQSKDIIEFAQKIDIDRPSMILKSALMIRDGRGDTLLLRINFYKVQNGRPGEQLNSMQIIRQIPASRGWHLIDLSQYQLKLDQPFFISYEYLPTEKNISFSFGSRMGGKTYTRSSSLGSWEKMAGASLSTYLQIRQ